MRLLPFLLLAACALPVGAQTPAAAPAAAPPDGMVYVPAGDFTMGTDDRDSSDFNQRDNVPLNANDARPRHTAKTGAFFIDKTEVTCARYQKFCQASGVPVPSYWIGGGIPAGQDNFPVHHVNWYEARAYAQWAGKRLPTETEWEKAARGTDARNYPWGNDWDSGKAVSSNEPVAVGQFPNGASPYGALDMCGNVAEWTQSWFDAYPKAPTKQPDFGTKLKAVRGGAWIGLNDLGRTWFRGASRPQARLMMIGFRCAKDAPANP